MRSRLCGLRRLRLLVLTLATAAGPAAAGPLTTATWLTEIGSFTAEPAILAEGFAVSSGLHDLNGCVCASLTLPEFQSVEFVLPGTSGGVLPLAYLLTLGGSQHFDGTRNGVQATKGIPGQFLVKVAQHIAKGTQASMYQVGPTTLLRVPLSIGAGATEMGTLTILSSPHMFTVYHGAWTGNSVVSTGLTSKYLPLPDAVAQATFLPPRDGQPGEITLVAPTRIHIHGPIAQRRTVSFTYLRMGFDWEENAVCVPEPGVTALLVAAFASGLSALRLRAA